MNVRICRELLARIFLQEPVDQALGGASSRPGRSALFEIRACSMCGLSLAGVQGLCLRVEKRALPRLTGLARPSPGSRRQAGVPAADAGKA
jgi:hypothetical protein